MKSVLLFLSVLGTLSAQAYYSQNQCMYSATLNTGMYVYTGVGPSPYNAQQDAINKCVKSGTISSFCTGGTFSYSIDPICQGPYAQQFQCTLNTGMYIYTGVGQTPYNAQQDAINKCVQSGTISSFCTGGTFSCQ